MAEKSSFFTSLNGDRKYKASDFAEYFKMFIGNGVFPNPSSNLLVTSNGDMTITLSPGFAWINGYMYHNTDNLTLTVEHADSILKRIDRVVVKCDFINREIKTYVKKGIFATNPAPPTLERGVNAYEISVADILVENGVVFIQQSKITDTRLDNNICGIVTQTVKEIETTELYRKLQAYIDETGQDVKGWVDEATSRWEVDFTTWFEMIKGALGEDVAGNLLNMINEDRCRLDTIEKTLDSISLEAYRITLKDEDNIFESDTVEGALKELYDKATEGSNTVTCRLNITCDDNSSVIGQIVTIKNIALETVAKHTLNSSLLELKLNKNTKYEINLNDKDNYETPGAQELTVLENDIEINFIYLKQRIFGFDINQNESDPYTRVTYTDSAIGIEPLKCTNGILNYGGWKDTYILRDCKPCMLKDGVRQYYLNPDNHALKYDGTNADIESGNDGDVMVEFKKNYYKIWLEDDILKFRVSATKIDETWKCTAFIQEDTDSVENDYMYIGMYLSNIVDDSKAVSLSDKSVSGGTIDNYRTYSSTNKGDKYQQLTLKKLTYVQMLSILVTKCTDMKQAIGAGTSVANTTGTMNDKGMFWAETTGSGSKLFFIENLWGSKQHLDGLRYYRSGWSLGVSLSLKAPYTSNYYGVAGLSGSNRSQFITKLNVSNDMVYPIATGGASNTYYASHFNYDDSYDNQTLYAQAGDSFYGGDHAGLFSYKGSMGYEGFYSRLTYC